MLDVRRYLYMLKDDGQRTTFGENGGTREIIQGRGRCDLLPLDVVGKVIGGSGRPVPWFKHIERFKKTKKVDALYSALNDFINSEMNGDFATAMMELSQHFEDGAKKYSENNWKRGIPIHSFLDSAGRHALKHLRGDTDEPHHRAFIWNLVCCIWTYEHKPELDDVEHDLKERITMTDMKIITTCKTCKQRFTISGEEAKWLSEKGLALYKRCPDCRKIRRETKHGK